VKFSYKARTKDGQLQVGNVEASSRDSAVNILNSHDLYVLNIEEVVQEKWYDRLTSFFNKVKVKDLMIFTRQFSTLLASQVSLSDSLNNLYKQTESPVLKEAITDISRDVDAGFSLSQALERQQGIFSDFYINMVKSAEVTGRLNEVLGFLADYLEKQTELTSKIKNAVTYPIFVIGLFLVVLVVMVTVVLPQITPIFEETDVEVPMITTIVIKVGTIASGWWWAILIALVAVTMVLIDYFKTKEGKVVFDELILRVPIFGGLFRKLYLARFAESTRMLIKGGLTIPQAIEVSSRTIGNSVYRNALHYASGQVRKGKLLSETLAELKVFPPLVSQLVNVGESTGRLGDLLEKINSFYSREVDNIVGNLVSLIQPILMIVIGLLVALLFASILLPLYSLTSSF
jgi:type IV pilus assembly protein PilC